MVFDSISKLYIYSVVCSSDPLLSMPVYQIDLGNVSLSQLSTGMQLVSHISIEVSPDVGCPIGPEFPYSSFLDSDHWIIAKPCFMISFFVSSQEGPSFPFDSQAIFLKHLGRILGKAEVRD